MEILYKITKNKEGFIAECTNEDIVTQGDSLDEVVKNLRESIKLHLGVKRYITKSKPPND